MSAFDDFLTWFNATPGASDYVPARGAWVEAPPTTDSQRFAVISFQGGGKPDVDRFSPVVDVLLLGRKAERRVAGALPDIEAFAYDLIRRSMSSTCAGSITAIRAMSTPVGPGFTTEDRPWYRLSFELTGVE